MKKTVLFLPLWILLLLFCNDTQAQLAFESIYGASAQTNAHSGIIRHYKEYEMISSNSSYDSTFFNILSLSVLHFRPNMRQVAIPYANAVNDFKIFDDWVYCCGKISETNCFYMFKIAQMGGNATTFIYYKCRDRRIRSIEKMVVYKYDGICYIDAIGQTINNKACVIHATCSNNQSISSCQVWESPYDTYSEYFDNIIVTDRYVVVAGRLMSNYENIGVNIRMFPKGMFNVTDLNYEYRISAPCNSVFNLCATAMASDTFAVVYPCFASKELYVIDAHTMTIVNQQQFLAREKNSAVDLVYILETESLALSQEYSNFFTNSQGCDVVELFPLATHDYLANCMFGNVIRPAQSMAVCQGYYLVTIDDNKYFSKDMREPYSSNCYYNDSYPIFCVPRARISTIYTEGVLIEILFDLGSSEQKNNNLYIDNKCNHAIPIPVQP